MKITLILLFAFIYKKIIGLFNCLLKLTDNLALSAFWHFDKIKKSFLKCSWAHRYKFEVNIICFFKLISANISSCCTAQLTWSCCFPPPPAHSVSFLPCCQLIGCRLVAESHGAIRAVALPPSASSAPGGLQLLWVLFFFFHTEMWNLRQLRTSLWSSPGTREAFIPRWASWFNSLCHCNIKDKC